MGWQFLILSKKNDRQGRTVWGQDQMYKQTLLKSNSVRKCGTKASAGSVRECWIVQSERCRKATVREKFVMGNAASTAEINYKYLA